MSLINDRIMLITENGLFNAIENRKKVAAMNHGQLMALVESGKKVYNGSSDYNGTPNNDAVVETDDFQYGYMLQRFGPLAVVTIKGTLVNNDDPWNHYFGEVGYPEIRSAILEAVDHAQVKCILLDMDCPGGQVSGITETFDFLKEVNSKHVPIYTHASSTMASGGYWLGSVGRKITCSELALVGSIGVIMVHASYERMYQESGIDITVLREGEFKALGTQYEKLSKAAKEGFHSEMAVIYDSFLARVSDARDISVATLKDTAAEGRVFYGNDAVKVGLVDSVDSFDSVATALIKKYSGSSGDNPINSGTGVDMTKKRVLSEKGQAAIAAGVPEATVMADDSLTTLVSDDSGGESTDTTENKDKPTGDKPVEEKTPEQKAAEQEATDKAAALAAAGKGDPAAAVITQLMKQLSDQGDIVAALKVQLGEATSAKTKMESSHEKLVKIAVGSIQRMQVAMGGTATKMEGLDASVVVDQYHQVLSQFNSKFKVGASAEVPSNKDTGQPLAGGEGGEGGTLLSQASQRLTL